MNLWDLLPDASTVLALEPEDLAGYVLRVLVSEGPRTPLLHPVNFRCAGTVDTYPNEVRDRIDAVCMEAWAYLEREGLIAHEPGNMHGRMFVTRRGHKVFSATCFADFRKASLLPKQLLHPSIAEKVWGQFIRGEYDTAVFQAFKEVEVAVRTAAGLIASDRGTDLMRKAFRMNGGPLTDPNAEPAEQEALGHLFAGAIGSYKNPGSHRHVAIGPEEAIEMVILASHLLRIVDARRPSPAPTVPA